VGECLARALKEAVVELANDEPKRRQLAETAITVARMNHDARIVRENFRKVFIN
jgi:hypothetical protein